MNIIKISSIVAYYILPVSIIAIAFAFQNYDHFVLMGKTAEILIYIILFDKPLAVLTELKPFKLLLLIRRQMGVAAFWLYLFHAQAMIYFNQINIFSYIGNLSSYIFWGSLAGLVMIILGLTSNNIAQRFLKRNWGKVQKLSYFALYFLLLHISLVTGNYAKLIFIGGGYAVLKLLQTLKQRSTKLSIPNPDKAGLPVNTPTPTEINPSKIL